MNSRSQLHTMITSVITTLGGYLQLQYQSRKKSPLEERRNIMAAIYVNLFMYGMGLMIEYKPQTQILEFLTIIIKRFSPLVGISVVVLLLLILFPVLGLAAFILWALLMVGALLKTIQEILQWLRRVFVFIKDVITSYFEGSSGGETDSQNEMAVEMHG